MIANALGLEEEDDVTAMEMDLMNNGDLGTSDSNKNKLKIFICQ
jgi:hypothetical protein